jgi:hypothetical protein
MPSSGPLGSTGGMFRGMDINPPVAPECQTGSFALSDPPYFKEHIYA